MPRARWLPLMALLALAPIAAGQRAEGPPKVAARLACTSVALRPGAENTLAVVLDVPEGWHVYAPALNDTGLPVSLEPRLPEGWTASPVSWPVPERLPEPGEMLDHVYTGKVVLAFTVQVPREAAGTSAKPSVHVDWMACNQFCVLGSADVALELPVAAAGAAIADSPDAALVKQVRLARALGESAPLKASLADGALVLHAPGASSLQFLPDADCAAPLDLLREGAAQGETLTLHLEPDATGAVRGIAVLAFPAGRATEFFRVELPLGAASIVPGSASRSPQPRRPDHEP